MKKFFNKKVIIPLTIFFALALIILGVFTYIFFIKEKFVFKLIGEDTIYLNIYEPYNELGVIATIDDKDISSAVTIDNSSVNVNNLGNYQVTYKVLYKEEEIVLIRNVKIVDKIAPTLTLIGNSEIIVKEGNIYQEQGCNAVDNYDEKVNDKVQILNYVNTKVVGTYKVIYNVVDESGNKATLTRTVNVIPKEIANSKEVDYIELMGSNRITNMSYTSNGILLEGYKKDNNGIFIIKLCKKDKKCINYNMNKKDNYYYGGELDFSKLDNGTYYMYIESGNTELVINKLAMEYRLSRANLNNKLISFNYTDDNIIITVEDFKYEYDILIDPGHGGNDPGALNSVIDEKRLNLEQSLYEKERYEEHGLKVLMLREDSSYGMVMGDNTWPQVRKKAYALGYYGTVSKITYSNHHNSSEDKSLMGWEIITSVSSDDEDLKIIYQIGKEWNNLYNLSEQHTRIYTRNYNTGTIFTKENSEEYYFTDYYAVIRLPYQLFNIKNVLYEGSYLSNKSDFDWYYTKSNWKQLSEIKIKNYVNLLGIEYIKPKEFKSQ